MTPQAKTGTTPSRNSSLRYNSAIIISVVIAILLACVILIIYIMWKRRQGVRKSNQIRDGAMEAHHMLPSQA